MSCRVLEESIPDTRAISELGVHTSAALGDIIRLKLLHKRFPDIIHAQDQNKWQPIHEASRGGHLDTVKFLLENGAHMGKHKSYLYKYNIVVCRIIY